MDQNTVRPEDEVKDPNASEVPDEDNRETDIDAEDEDDDTVDEINGTDE